MRIIAVSVGSFVVGACVGTLFLSGLHTSTVVQSVCAAELFIGGGKYEPPVVNPLDTATAWKDVHFDNTNRGAVTLDGINCKHCTFDNALFEYRGGLIYCPDCQFTSPKRTIVFSGAALNTLKLLQYLQSLHAMAKPFPWEGNPKGGIKLTPRTSKAMSLMVLPGDH